jgi:hypothetical protein
MLIGGNESGIFAVKAPNDPHATHTPAETSFGSFGRNLKVFVQSKLAHATAPLQTTSKFASWMEKMIHPKVPRWRTMPSVSDVGENSMVSRLAPCEFSSPWQFGESAKWALSGLLFHSPWLRTARKGWRLLLP